LTEQALDVEATHAMAPGAAILFVGAQDCTDNALLAALQTAVSSGASIVTDSWGSTAGDLFTDAATKTAFDNTFELAAASGVSVLFSSGDSGDNFADTGLAVPNYPASDPYITSIGGTTLEIGIGSLAWQSGGGGGTSYSYAQPFYQASVVPAALALRNAALFGPVPQRVEPDIALDGDAQSGMLIGVTQTFPNSLIAYNEFKEGGTSLASPLLAGEIADADQAAGVTLGFLNPILYAAYRQHPTAFNDIVAPATPDAADVIRVDFTNTIDSSNGYNVSLRTIGYAGPETYCDGTGNCATRNVTLTATPGFDSLTGLGSPGATFIGVLKGY
jgi:subtilase family serine protease